MGSICLQILFLTWICIASGYIAPEGVSEIVVSAWKVHHSYGEDVTIRCKVSTGKFLGIDWYRDKNEICTSSSNWCRQENTTVDEAGDYHSVLHLLNLSANHSYTCASQEMTASFFIRVGAKPEILQLTIIPEEPQTRGRQVQVVCVFSSLSPPFHHRIEETEVDDRVEAPLSTLRDHEYEINVTFHPVLKQRFVSCRVSNPYGSTERNITVQVDDQHLQEECISGEDCVTPNAVCNGKSCQCPALLPVAINYTMPNQCLEVLEFGDRCKKSEQCYAGDNHTLCDARKRRCLCIPRYSKAKDKCILTPERSLGLLMIVGSFLILTTCSMLGLYYYRIKKDKKKMLENNNDSDTYEMETRKQDTSKRVQFEPATIP